SDLAGRGLIFQGTTLEFHPVSYPRKDECYSHDTWEQPTRLGLGVADARLGDLLERARAHHGREATIELNHDVLRALECPNCRRSEEVLTSLGRVTERQAACPDCGATRIPHALHTID